MLQASSAVGHWPATGVVGTPRVGAGVWGPAVCEGGGVYRDDEEEVVGVGDDPAPCAQPARAKATTIVTRTVTEDRDMVVSFLLAG